MQLCPAESCRLDMNIGLKYCFHSAYAHPPCARHFVVKGLKVKLYLYDSVSLKLSRKISLKLTFFFVHIPDFWRSIYLPFIKINIISFLTSPHANTSKNNENLKMMTFKFYIQLQ